MTAFAPETLPLSHLRPPQDNDLIRLAALPRIPDLGYLNPVPMKNRIFPCLLVLFFSFTAVFGQTTYRALFLGNSYTNNNNLPNIVRSLTLAGGDSMVTDKNTPGGYTFQGHSTNSTTLNKIAAGNWDFVVLQEQSQRPAFSQGQVATEVYPYAKALVDSARFHNDCVEPVFYMTWGRKYGDQQNCAILPYLCSFEGMQLALKQSYLQMAVDNQSTAAPVGMAWWSAMLQDTTLELFAGDGSHPNFRGSYLTACVFYGTMIRKSPIGLNYYGSLDSTMATFLQTVAHHTVFDSLSQWQIGHADVVADFSSSSNGQGIAQFTDQSTNATSWNWDFGDGGNSSLVNPSHTYNQNGTYSVTLIATDGCTSDTSTQTLTVQLVGIEDEIGTFLVVAPQPAEDWFRVEWTDEIKPSGLWVSDLQGRKVLEVRLDHIQVNSQIVNSNILSSGNYLLTLKGEQGLWTRKLVVR